MRCVALGRRLNSDKSWFLCLKLNQPRERWEEREEVRRKEGERREREDVNL